MNQYCPRCEQDLPQDAYHPDKWGKRGHYCRECVIEYKRQWRRKRGQLTLDQWRQKIAKPPKPPRVLSTGYRPVHKRITRVRGKASAQQCAHCPLRAAEWAYDHTDPSPIVGPTSRGIRVEYSTDLTRYIALCKRCHALFDAKVTP